MKVLIIDDSRGMRVIVRRTLRLAGLDVTDVLEAANGKEALDVAEGAWPGLILCDWNMPEMSGLELLHILKEKNCPSTFGFVTSESTQEMRDQAMAAGAQFLITKPFTPESFGRALAPVLSDFC